MYRLHWMQVVCLTETARANITCAPVSEYR